MRAVRLKNIRSLSDTGDILIKPITLLLGQNSSGKSTVLRAFPLVKQSIRTRSNAPILWYGDLVDFGSAREVLSTFAKGKPISFQFDIGSVRMMRSGYSYYVPRENDFSEATVAIDLNEVDGKTRLSSFEVKFSEDTLRVSIDGRGLPTKVEVNGLDFTRMLSAERFKFSTSEIVPQLIRTSPDVNRNPFLPRNSRFIDGVEKEVRKFFSDRLHSRVQDRTITSIINRINYRPGWKFLVSIQDACSSLRSAKELSQRMSRSEGSEDFNYIRSLFMLWDLPELLSAIDRKFTSTFSAVSYVGPSRATGERYYRMQELAVDQIDPQGRNLAMFLNSLTATQQKAFSDWLMEAFGYAVKVERSTGHIQLQLREEASEKFYNIADMGYGFSQVLPIMAQVWSRRAKTGLGAPSVLIAMEQPELHLHPAYQAKLADVFARSIIAASSGRDGPREARFVIETHSEALINRLGELVYQGKLDPADVAIYVFERGDSDGATQIRSVTFQDDGTLKNWPVGFFSSVQ